VAVPEPPGILVGLIDDVNPVVPESERDTVPEKWFRGIIVMIDEPVFPALILALATLVVIE
jgi:hypothetical protein